MGRTMGSRVMASTWMLALVLATIVGTTAGARAQVVYSNDFESGDRSRWITVITDPNWQAPIRITRTPFGQRAFLGEFGSQTVRLLLDPLPPHDSLRISFDLFVIETWDGNDDPRNSPDLFELVVDGGSLVRTSFGNHAFDIQSYPEAFPVGRHPSRTGAVESNTLGYVDAGDAVYRFTFVIPHTASIADINFIATLSEAIPDIDNESWGIDNVVITAEHVEKPSLRLEVASAIAEPGERVEIPIRLRDARFLSKTKATSIDATFRYRASLLEPLDDQLSSTRVDADREITLNIPLTTGPDSIAAKLSFMALLGDDTATALDLVDLVPVGGPLETTVTPGRFSLDGLCLDGGVRLVDVSLAALRVASLDRSATSAEVMLSLVEDGATRLLLYDPAGRVALVGVDDVMSHGEHQVSLDLTALPAGLYHLVLQTPTLLLSHPLPIVR